MAVNSQTTLFKFVAENQHLLNISEIAKLAGMPRQTLQDIILNPNRWKEEDYRIEVIMSDLRDSLNKTFKNKYAGK